MAISLDEVSRIAKLARLEFESEQKQKLQHELSSILDYVDQLRQIEGKTEDIILDPDAINLMRDDIAMQVESPEEFLSQAPGRDGKFIKVKSILE